MWARQTNPEHENNAIVFIEIVFSPTLFTVFIKISSKHCLMWPCTRVF